MQRRQFLTRSTGGVLLLAEGLPKSARADPLHAQHELEIHAPIDHVFARMIDIDHWSDWNPAITAATLEGPCLRGSTFTWRSHGFRIASTLVDVDAPHLLSWSGVALGTRAAHRWSFTKTANGTQVVSAESLDGWLPGLLPGAMQDMLDDTLRAWLAALKAAAEGAQRDVPKT